MAKKKKQNRGSNKSTKNTNRIDTNSVKEQSNSANEFKPDDRPRRDGPGGS